MSDDVKRLPFDAIPGESPDPRMGEAEGRIRDLISLADKREADELATLRARLADAEDHERRMVDIAERQRDDARIDHSSAEAEVRRLTARLAEVERERDDAKHCMTRALDERDAADARTREAWANLSTAESARDAAQERVAALEAERDAERRKAEAAQTAAYRVLGCADAECDGCDKAGNCEYRSAEASALGNIIVADDAMERVSKAIQVLAEPLSLTESVRLIASARGVRITRALAILRGEV